MGAGTGTLSASYKKVLERVGFHHVAVDDGAADEAFEVVVAALDELDVEEDFEADFEVDFEVDLEVDEDLKVDEDLEADVDLEEVLDADDLMDEA